MTNRISFNNLQYASEFLRYLIDHPEEAERIPDGAVIIFSAEAEDLRFAAAYRSVLQSMAAYHGRTIVPVGVQEIEGVKNCHTFVFPWSGSQVWLRLDPAEWIQESLSAALGRQPATPTRYIGMQHPVIPAPRLEYSQPRTSKATR